MIQIQTLQGWNLMMVIFFESSLDCNVHFLLC